MGGAGRLAAGFGWGGAWAEPQPTGQATGRLLNPGRRGMGVARRMRAPGGSYAATRSAAAGSTARRATTSASIIASVWKGVAQRRRRSPPRGTVG